MYDWPAAYERIPPGHLAPSRQRDSPSIDMDAPWKITDGYHNLSQHATKGEAGAVEGHRQFT